MSPDLIGNCSRHQYGRTNTASEATDFSPPPGVRVRCVIDPARPWEATEDGQVAYGATPQEAVANLRS